jgi:hypothetical protein
MRLYKQKKIDRALEKQEKLFQKHLELMETARAEQNLKKFKYHTYAAEDALKQVILLTNKQRLQNGT